MTVFCASLSDFCDEAWPVEVTKRLFNTIRDTPNLFWLLLTKRPERLRATIPWSWEPWPNVGLGVTAEDQRRADERIPILLDTPAAMRFVSVEPMLGPVDLDRMAGHWLGTGCLDWIICGGETGAGARPMDSDWARDLRDLCRAASVPFFMKQMTNKAPIPPDLMVREFPDILLGAANR